MKKIMIVISLLLFFLIIEKNVYAQTYNLVLDRQEGIYYARRGGDLPYYSSQFIIYRLGNEIAYCIEPSKNITTYNYVDTNGDINLPYSDEIKRKIQLIGYFGREYPGHNNVRYSMAAQALIWNLTSNQDITFYTRPYEEGEVIDVSREKEEIMNLVNNYHELSIPQTIYGKYNELITFKDDNLINYEINNLGGNDTLTSVILEENKLQISSKVIGESFFELRRKSYDDKSTLIFIGNDKDNTQTLGRLRLPNLTYRIYLNIEGIKIHVHKVDEENNPIRFQGIKFKVKNLDTNTFHYYETDGQGIIITEGLNYGNYEIEELDQMIPGYKVSDEKKQVVISDTRPLYYTSSDGHYVDVYFVNKKVRGKLQLSKKQEKYVIDNENISYDLINGCNIKFKLYKNNVFLKELITDENGYLEENNLELGEYTLEEIVPENYYSDNNYYTFTINQTSTKESEIIKTFTINNYLRKGNLLITKVDAKTLIGIPETVFDIYYQDTYFLTKETDENGLINLQDLPIGNYYLQEKSANPKYQLINEKIFFEIKENEETSLTIENEEISIKVPETMDNTNCYFHLSSILLLIGLAFYEKTH